MIIRESSHWVHNTERIFGVEWKYDNNDRWTMWGRRYKTMGAVLNAVRNYKESYPSCFFRPCHIHYEGDG